MNSENAARPTNHFRCDMNDVPGTHKISRFLTFSIPNSFKALCLWPGERVFLASSRRFLKASLTDSEVGKWREISGASTTIFVSSAYCLAYLPRTPLLKLYFGFRLRLIQIQVRHFHIPSVHGLSRVMNLLS